jgi:hypothetical protein
MAISNTFSLPSSGKSFTLSLVDFNNSFLSLWSNFYGPSVPNINNITIQGTATGPYEGMLYRSSVKGAFYVYDPTAAKGGSIGGGFTRVGIASRNYENITQLVANVSSIEQTELITTVGDSSANYRLYMKTNNSGGIVDVGLPAAASLISSMFVARQVPNTAIALESLTSAEMAPRSINGDRLANNLIYQSSANVGGQLGLEQNVWFINSGTGIRWGDNTRQASAGVQRLANAGHGTSLWMYKVPSTGNAVMKTATTSLTFTGGAVGTGSFAINDDAAGTLTFALTLGSSVGSGTGVGVGVGVSSIAK